MKCLFLGGVADGRRIDVDASSKVWIVPVRFNWRDDYSLGDPAEIQSVKIATNVYHRVRFTDLDGTEFVVFAYDDDNLKPLARLISRYETLDANRQS